jgi:subtilisin family serine protease
MPSATPEHLAEAIVDCVGAGARVINLSSALLQPLPKGDRAVEEAMDYAGSRNVIVVAAVGNQGTVGSSPITRNSSAIPVAACNSYGRPLAESNLGTSIGRRGLLAPGENITSLGTDGQPRIFSGTSAASPFVTGAIALLWSEFPASSAVEVKSAITGPEQRRRSSVVPPLMDAWAAYKVMTSVYRSGGI